MSDPVRIDRRRFFQLTGGGIAVFVSLGPSALFSQENRSGYPEDFNAYLLIGKDGRVTVFSGKIEMGQGVMTSQAQMVAEELGVALASIDMVLGDTDRCPFDRGTFGSLTTRMFGPALRAAAAEARLVLLRLASKKLGAATEKLVVENGVVSVVGEPSRRVTYGELSEGKRIARVVGEKAVLRAVGQFQVMGGSPRRIDAPEKVTGHAKYAGDIRPAGMLYARILRPPAHGAKLGKARHLRRGKAGRGDARPERRPRRRPACGSRGGGRGAGERPRRVAGARRDRGQRNDLRAPRRRQEARRRSRRPAATSPPAGPRRRGCSRRRTARGTSPMLRWSPMPRWPSSATESSRSGPRPRLPSRRETGSPRPSASTRKTSASSRRSSAAVSGARAPTGRPSKPRS